MRPVDLHCPGHDPEGWDDAGVPTMRGGGGAHSPECRKHVASAAEREASTPAAVAAATQSPPAPLTSGAAAGAPLAVPPCTAPLGGHAPAAAERSATRRRTERA